MGDFNSPATQSLKSMEDAHNTHITKSDENLEAEVKVEEDVNNANNQVEIDVKAEDIPGSKLPSDVADVANPLFGRAGSAHVKEEDCEEVQVVKAPPRSRNTSGKPRLRRKATVNKFVELTKLLQSKLEADNGVEVDCTYFADDIKAKVNTLLGQS